MSAVMRQDPWGVMPRLQEEINRLFGNARENDSSSATATGELIHMACQPCHLTIRLSGVTRSRGWLYYSAERITYPDGGGTQRLHWSWASRNYT